MRSFILLTVVGSCTAQNLVQNGDFDASGTSPTQAIPWTLSPPGPTQVAIEPVGRSGNAALLQCQENFTCQIWQSISTDRATTYRLSFYAKQTQSGSPSSGSYFGADFGLNSQTANQSDAPGALHIDPTSVPTDWTQFTVDTPGDGPNDLVLFYGFGASGAFAIDDVSITALGPSGSNSSSSPSPSGGAAPSPSPSTSNGAVIGGAVGGAIGGVILIAILLSCTLSKRFRKWFFGPCLPKSSWRPDTAPASEPKTSQADTSQGLSFSGKRPPSPSTAADDVSRLPPYVPPSV